MTTDKQSVEEKCITKRPWYKSYAGARTRCKNGKYAKRGIKFLMSPNDFEFIWNRDKAWTLSSPSIDRIDNEGDYVLDNCRFIEVATADDNHTKRIRND